MNYSSLKILLKRYYRKREKLKAVLAAITTTKIIIKNQIILCVCFVVLFDLFIEVKQILKIRGIKVIHRSDTELLICSHRES